MAPWTVAMHTALELAAHAPAGGDIPVGALVLDPDGRVLATAHNRCEVDGDPTAHAEMLAIRDAAARLGDLRLVGCTLVVTLEPCTMCAGAIVLARLERLVLGAWDPKAGACGSVRDVVRDSRLNHRVEVIGGVEAGRSARLLRAFFAQRRLRRPSASPAFPPPPDP